MATCGQPADMQCRPGRVDCKCGADVAAETEREDRK